MKLNELMEKYGDYEVKDGFMELLEKPKPKSVYDLNYEDTYYFIHDYRNLSESVWRNDVVDMCRLSIGNVFLTREDAEFEVERLKVIAELKKYAKEFSDDEWSNSDMEKCVIYRSIQDNRVYILKTYTVQYPCLLFENKEKAEEAIKAVGEERIKKYYFGVRE